MTAIGAAYAPLLQLPSKDLRGVRGLCHFVSEPFLQPLAGQQIR